MSSVFSLRTLCKKAVLEHPKLEFHDPKGYCRKALDKALNSEVAISTLKAALENTSIKTYKIIYDKKIYGEIFVIDGIARISLGKTANYYHTRASKDDIPKKYLKHLSSDELKKVAGVYTLDSILTHELCHANNMANLTLYKEASKMLTLQNDMDDEEERETILYGENTYLEELGRPKRVDHRTSFFPGHQKILRNKFVHKNKIVLQFAFENYLINGLHLDAIKISEKLTNKEIETVLFEIDPKIVTSEYFLEILLALIEERGLKIDFSDPNLNSLLEACLKFIPTFDQFQKLEKLGADIEILSVQRHFLFLTLKEKFSKISNLNFNLIIKLSSAFRNVELLKFLLTYDVQISTSRYLLDMILFLINDRKLNIDFDDPKHALLFNVCTRSTKNIKQFKNFRKLLSNNNQKKLDKSPIIFKTILYNSNQKDIMFLSQNHSNIELENILSTICLDDNFSTKISQDFLDNLLHLIETRDLNIDVRDSKWTKLLDVCLAVQKNTH